MFRCFNDIFGYCSGKPKVKTTEGVSTYKDMGGKQSTIPITITTCKLDPETCGKYQTQSQLQKELEAQHA